MRILITAFLFLVSVSAIAQTGKITKVKGGRAIVDFGGQSVSEGQTVSIGGGSSTSSSSFSGGGRPRQHGLNYGLSYTSFSGSGSDDKDTVISVRYGYNMGQFEIGPTLDMSVSDPDGIKATLFGGFGQYNFTENRPGNILIPYVQGLLRFGSSDPGGVSITDFGGGGGVLFFPFADSFAADFKLLFGNRQQKVGSASTSLSLLELSAGWKIYF